MVSIVSAPNFWKWILPFSAALLGDSCAAAVGTIATTGLELLVLVSAQVSMGTHFSLNSSPPTRNILFNTVLDN